MGGLAEGEGRAREGRGGEGRGGEGRGGEGRGGEGRGGEGRGGEGRGGEDTHRVTMFGRNVKMGVGYMFMVSFAKITYF